MTSPDQVFPDANGWIEGLDSAPKDETILVCVAETNDDGSIDYNHSTAWWHEDDGEWLHDFMREPTHWKPLDLPVAYESSTTVSDPGYSANTTVATSATYTIGPPRFNVK